MKEPTKEAFLGGLNQAGRPGRRGLVGKMGFCVLRQFCTDIQETSEEMADANSLAVNTS